MEHKQSEKEENNIPLTKDNRKTDVTEWKTKKNKRTTNKRDQMNERQNKHAGVQKNIQTKENARTSKQTEEKKKKKRRTEQKEEQMKDKTEVRKKKSILNKGSWSTSTHSDLMWFSVHYQVSGCIQHLK